ncbi:hypothetical protein [Nocardia sp. XZ_19_385]|uniref:hypothetical protein n=1 Tax=Nocardia sp. XZ_19_385 TaxID=2769488 RepID=UPI00188F7BEC|nr:hypothetical protein [Nocardia sp. XZ_19_385]
MMQYQSTAIVPTTNSGDSTQVSTLFPVRSRIDYRGGPARLTQLVADVEQGSSTSRSAAGPGALAALSDGLDFVRLRRFQGCGVCGPSQRPGEVSYCGSSHGGLKPAPRHQDHQALMAGFIRTMPPSVPDDLDPAPTWYMSPTW